MQERRRDEGRTICVILGGGRGQRLLPLTKERSKPAVPLGGKYRLIDVPISNCLNSGFNNIYVLTQFQSASLHGHVSQTYRFDRFGGGFVELLAAQQTMDSSDWYQGTADAVRQNLIHFGGEYDEALILSGDQLYRMDFRKLLDHHRRTKAAMTIAVLPVNAEAASSLGILKIDETGRVTSFHEKPPAAELSGLETARSMYERFGVDPAGRDYTASMGIYVFNKEILVRELNEHKYVDFGKHLFPRCIDRHVVQAYMFDGYWEDIGTVKSFHEANIQLAAEPEQFSFASDEGIIFTRARTLPSSILRRTQVEDSLIAEGCRIGRSSIVKSVVGIRSRIGDRTALNRTIVMGADYFETSAQKKRNREIGVPDVGIGDDVVIENAIIDKNARIGDRVSIRFSPRIADHTTPIYQVRDGVVCVLKDAIVQSGTRIGDDA